MASGFESLHPRTVITFKELGIPSNDVIQGWGSAAASAGTHDILGQYQGTSFGSCVDIPHDTYGTREWIDRLIGASMCPFVRDSSAGWSQAEHVHVVIPCLPADDGSEPMLDICRGQVEDFYNGLSGLVGHAPFPAAYAGTEAERQEIRTIYLNSYQTEACTVYAPDGSIIAAYCYLVGDHSTCELRPVAEALGAKVDWDTSGLHVYQAGKEVNTSGWNVVVEEDFTRVPISTLVKGLGHDLTFTPGGPNLVHIT